MWNKFSRLCLSNSHTNYYDDAAQWIVFICGMLQSEWFFVLGRSHFVDDNLWRICFEGQELAINHFPILIWIHECTHFFCCCKVVPENKAQIMIVVFPNHEPKWRINVLISVAICKQTEFCSDMLVNKQMAQMRLKIPRDFWFIIEVFAIVFIVCSHLEWSMRQ